MRTWLTTRETQALLGGLSQQRISQLVRDGTLAVERDVDGRLKYDRATVEAEARERAARSADTAAHADERRALQAEARDRFRRERERQARVEEERRQAREERADRTLAALERIAACLDRR